MNIHANPDGVNPNDHTQERKALPSESDSTAEFKSGRLPAPESDTSVSYQLKLRKIEAVRDQAVEGFCETYVRAFSGAPYFEKYTADWVYDKVWVPHVPHCIVVAEVDGNVVGLGCVHPLKDPTMSPSSREYLLSRKNLPFDPAKTIYMSELAVDDRYRGLGIGSRVVHACYEWARQHGFENYTLRTAAEGSNSLRLYKRLGASELSGTHAVDSVEGGQLSTQSKSRVYLWGKLK